MDIQPVRPLDDLRARLDRSGSAVWQLPGLTRDDVVAWADNAPVSWVGDRRVEMLNVGGERQHDADYRRFCGKRDAAEVEGLVTWYVRRLIPAAAITEGIAWGVTVVPGGNVLARVIVGSVETLVIWHDDGDRLGAFVNLRGSVLDTAYDAGELTLRDLFGDDYVDGKTGTDDAGDGALSEDREPTYRTVGDDHARLYFDSFDEARRVLSLPPVARAARLLNAALLPSSAANAKAGHCPALVDAAFPNGRFQPAG